MTVPGGADGGPGGGVGRPVALATPARGRRRTVLRMLALIVSALVLAFLAATWAARSEAPHPVFTEAWPEPPLVIAHQGGDGLWPSNTRYAFARAAELGADVLEMDVHLSADGHLVVIHDDTVDRTTELTGPVDAFAAVELDGLDAGWAWRPEGRDGPTPYRGEVGGVPRLRDVLRDHPDTPLVIEIKPDGVEAARALCALLREEGRTGDTVVASFHEDATAAFRGACPEVATGATRGEVRTFLVLARLRLDGPYRPPFEALQVPVREGSIEVITPAFVRAAHAKDVQVHAWTIDDPDEMARLLEMGVDGLITDRPDRALLATGRDVPAGQVPDFVDP